MEDNHGVLEVQELRRVRRCLRAEFAPAVPVDQVDRCLDSVVARFDAARIRRFVPVIAERVAREELRHVQHQADEGPADPAAPA